MVEIWCLIGAALLMALLGLAALIMRPRPPRLAQVRPGRLVRGCIALLCLGVATGLAGMALLLVLR